VECADARSFVRAIVPDGAADRSQQSAPAERHRCPAQELFDLLLDATADGIMDMDLAAGGVAYSPRWLALLGYDEHEHAATPELWRRLSHPDDVPAVEAALGDHQQNYWPFAHTWRMRHRTGEWRSVLGRAVTLREADGRPRRTVMVCSDVTEQARVEQQLQTLSTAVPALLETLSTCRKLLEQCRTRPLDPDEWEAFLALKQPGLTLL
jgi:PAS domain S-box-containing protein